MRKIIFVLLLELSNAFGSWLGVTVLQSLVVSANYNTPMVGFGFDF